MTEVIWKTRTSFAWAVFFGRYICSGVRYGQSGIILSEPRSGKKRQGYPYGLRILTKWFRQKWQSMMRTAHLWQRRIFQRIMTVKIQCMSCWKSPIRFCGMRKRPIFIRSSCKRGRRRLRTTLGFGRLPSRTTWFCLMERHSNSAVSTGMIPTRSQVLVSVWGRWRKIWNWWSGTISTQSGQAIIPTLRFFTSYVTSMGLWLLMKPMWKHMARLKFTMQITVMRTSFTTGMSQ